MRTTGLLFPSLIAMAAFCIMACSENKPTSETATPQAVEKPDYGGFESQVEWGDHLVAIGGCNDCHTPKVMTPQGPVDDTTRMLSGHPASMPAPDIDRKQMESKGLIVTQTFTAWIGPWGISYSANLTPDPTGLGAWTEDQFVYAIKNSISKGLPGSRPLMPPMSLMPVKLMSTEELKAVFAYLKTIKPINNPSVQPTPPALVAK
jgi:mono/diheme cytochrome c family protein